MRIRRAYGVLVSSSLSPKVENLECQSQRQEKKDVSAQRMQLPHPLPFGSIQALNGLDDTHPHTLLRMTFFTEFSFLGIP